MTITLTTPAAAPAYGRTASATRTHLVDCPHLVGREVVAVDAPDFGTHPLCEWSRDQLDGTGRSHPATLDDAMRDQGTPVHSRPLIKQYLEGVDHDEIWLPYSRSYVALGRDGRAVATFGKAWIWIRDVGRFDLPGYRGSSGEGRRVAPTYGDSCPRCFLQMPLSGTCDQCG